MCAEPFGQDNEKDDNDQPITDPWSVADFVLDLNEGNDDVDPMLTQPLNTTALDAKPAAGSPALTGGVTPSDAFFTPVTFIGGVDPADDWTQGWTTSVRN